MGRRRVCAGTTRKQELNVCEPSKTTEGDQTSQNPGHVAVHRGIAALQKTTALGRSDEDQHSEKDKAQKPGFALGYKEIAEGVNGALDQLFGYNLKNALKIVNVCIIAIVGVNAVVLYEQLAQSHYSFTLVPSLLLGFLTLACCFLFILNIWMANLPQDALKKTPHAL